MIHFRTPLNLGLVALLVLATLAGLVLIPTDAQVAVHWGLGGDVNGTLPKLQALAQMPLATAAIWAIFWMVERYGNKERQAGQVRALNIGLTALTALFAVIQIVIVVVAR
jgi:hypothetical protein